MEGKVCPWRYGWMVFFLAAGCLLLSFTVAPAMDTTFEVAAGYDDNAAEVTDGEGSGLARYRVGFSQPIRTEAAGPDLDLFLEGLYSQYFSLDDNYQLRAGTEFTTLPWHNRLQTSLFAEVMLYRDDLVAEDERNSLLVGGELQWLVDARLTLSIQEVFSKVDYRNQVSLPGQRAYSVGSGRGRGAGGQHVVIEEEWTTLSRDDTLWTTELMAFYAISPDIQADISFLYSDANSSDDYESYQELGGTSRVSWYYSEFLEIFVSGFWSKLDYGTVLEVEAHSDDVYGFTIGGNRSIGAFNVFVELDRTVNDSPVDGEDFKKSVVLCGVSYTF